MLWWTGIVNSYVIFWITEGYSFIHSFIHYEDLYSAPSRLLLRSAPDPSTAEKDSFEARIERFRVDSGMQAQHQRKPVPERGANHWEGAILLSSCAGKRDHEHAPLSRAERATTRSTQGRAAEVAKIGRGEAQQGPPDQSDDPIRDPLLEGEPVKHIQHITWDVAKSGNASAKACGRTQDPVQAPQPTSWEANIEWATVIKSGCDERVDECSGGVWSKWASNSAELAQLIVW